MNKFQKIHKKLIESANGIVNDIFVEKVGVVLTKKSMLTEEAQLIFDKMNIDEEESLASQHAEFNSRLTYLSFNEKKSSSKEYNKKMIHDFGHRSIYNDELATFLIAGCSIETLMEFIAHNEATVARLTSSKTKAQDDCLYRLQKNGFSEEFIELQKSMIKKIIFERSLVDRVKFSSNENEVFNIMNLGNKAVSFTITMSIKDWHKTLIGRLSNSGVELEMLEILNSITDILFSEYPYFFNTKEEYFKMGNNKKYE